MRLPEICPVSGSKFKCEMSKGDRGLCSTTYWNCPAFSAWFYYKAIKEASKGIGKELAKRMKVSDE